MGSDSYAKIVLSLILVCLVMLVARGFSGSERGSESEVGRYTFLLHGLRMKGHVLVRTDTVTGEVWGLRQFGSDEPIWLPMDAAAGGAGSSSGGG